MTGGARLRESVRRTLRRAGRAGWTGLALLVAAAVLAVADNALITQQRAELAIERAQLVSIADVASTTGSAPLLGFFAGFPPSQNLPRILSRIYEFSDSHGLNVERTEYRRVDEAGVPLVRVSLQLPVQGDFSALYAWLNEMLSVMPELGLESLIVRREDSGSEQVNAEVRLVVFVRKAS
jgi:Type II secretion system (T2SS), protein M subtype b